MSSSTLPVFFKIAVFSVIPYTCIYILKLACHVHVCASSVTLLDFLRGPTDFSPPGPLSMGFPKFYPKKSPIFIFIYLFIKKNFF